MLHPRGMCSLVCTMFSLRFAVSETPSGKGRMCQISKLKNVMINQNKGVANQKLRIISIEKNPMRVVDGALLIGSTVYLSKCDGIVVHSISICVCICLLKMLYERASVFQGLKGVLRDFLSLTEGMSHPTPFFFRKFFLTYSFVNVICFNS